MSEALSADQLGDGSAAWSLRGEYVLAQSDLDDAFQKHAMWTLALSGQKGTITRNITGLAMAGALAIIVIVGKIIPGSFLPEHRWSISPLALILSVAGVPLFLLLIAVIMVGQRRQEKAMQPAGLVPFDASKILKKSKGAGRGLFGWILFVGLAVVMFAILVRRGRTSSPAGGPPPAVTIGSTYQGRAILDEGLFDVRTLSGETLFGFHAGALLLATVVLGWTAVRVNRKQRSDVNAHLLRPTTVYVAPEGMTFETELTRSFLRWGAFVKFMETEAIVLLYEPAQRFHVVPKRCFPDPAQADQLVQILADRVGNGVVMPRASAFPVQPLPVISLAEDARQT